MAKERTVSGMRPTGPLHIGHYFGALKNWVAHAGGDGILLLRGGLARPDQ